MNDIYELNGRSRLPLVCPGTRASGTSCRNSTSGQRNGRLPRIHGFRLARPPAIKAVCGRVAPNGTRPQSFFGLLLLSASMPRVWLDAAAIVLPLFQSLNDIPGNEPKHLQKCLTDIVCSISFV